MSEQAILYLGVIGLLGKYCPKSREKSPHFSDMIECMHLEPFQEHLDFSDHIKAQQTRIFVLENPLKASPCWNPSATS